MSSWQKALAMFASFKAFVVAIWLVAVRHERNKEQARKDAIYRDTRERINAADLGTNDSDDVRRKRLQSFSRK